MTLTWAAARLGDVLRTTTCDEPIDRSATYRLLGVRLDSGGPFLREEKAGTAISAKKLAGVRAGEFIYSRLFAWRGAFGVIPPELNGCHVSGEFPTFAAVPERLDLNFLRYWFRLPGTLRAVEAWCSGSTPLTRNRLKEERFLALELPLPPLTEQHRIVARIEGIRAKLDGAKALRRLAEVEARQIVAAAEMRIWPTESAGASALSDVTTYLARGRQSKQGLSSHMLIKTQHVQQGRLLGSDILLAPEVAAKVPAEACVRENDILIACSAAGCLGRVAQFSRPCVTASTDTHVAIARADPGRVSPDYLYAYLRGAQGQMQLRSREKGDWRREKVGFRLTELNVADLRRVPVPIPPVSEQRRIVAYLDDLQSKVDALKPLQEKAAAELDALMPSILDKAFRGEL